MEGQLVSAALSPLLRVGPPQLRIEQLTPHVRTNGYRVLTSPARTATKIAALLDRPDSLPRRKDRHEILKLLEDPAKNLWHRVRHRTGAGSVTVQRTDCAAGTAQFCPAVIG